MESITTGDRKFWNHVEEAKRQTDTVSHQGLCQFALIKQMSSETPKELGAS